MQTNSYPSRTFVLMWPSSFGLVRLEFRVLAYRVCAFSVAMKTCFSQMTAKKGKRRHAQRIPTMKRPSASTKPKAGSYRSVPYVRHGRPTQKTRGIRNKVEESIKTIYLNSTHALIKGLQKSGHLPSMEGATCKSCGVGTMGALIKRADRGYCHACSKCKTVVKCHGNHPIFSTAQGLGYIDFRDQVAVLFCAVHGVAMSKCHFITGQNECVIDRVYSSYEATIAKYVVIKEKQISYGGEKFWSRRRSAIRSSYWPSAAGRS